jgi:hypothetical protein
MGSGWRVVDGDADDVRRLQGALVAIVDDLLTTRTDIGAGVFPALAQNHAVDEQLLDLLVMLFDHVFLQYEGSSKNPTSLAAKIDAYASAGIVTPVRLSIKHGYTRPLANELDLYDLGRSSLDDAGFTEIPFDMAVQILAEYHTAHDVRRSPLAFSESMNQWLSSNFDNAAPPLLLNRMGLLAFG